MNATLFATTRPSRPSVWWRLAVLLCACPGIVVAEPEGRDREIHITASEQCLWLVVVSDSKSRLFFREAVGDFDPGRSTARRIVAQTAVDRDLLVFFEDGAVYRYRPGTEPPTAEAVLPERQIPLELVGRGGRVYAIIPPPSSADVPAVATRATEEPPSAFDAAESGYRLAIFDGRKWSFAATLPAAAQPSGGARPRARLCAAQGKLMLFAPGQALDELQGFHFDDEHRRWVSEGPINVERPAEYWAVEFCQVPTLVTVTHATGEGKALRAFRLLGDPARADATSWRPGQLEFSGLPENVAIARYADVVGFNQHLGLLALGADGQAYLRFARIDDPPTEPTVPVAQLLVPPGILQRGRVVFQGITFLLLLGVLVGLFVLRRGSMVRVIELPTGCALALSAQRLTAWLIDFTPFTVAAAAVVGIPWKEGLGALGRWGISPNAEGSIPEQNVLVWWGLSIFGYTTYSLVMELIVRRTVGKLIARVHLVSEAGTRPTAGQILIRNLTRLIELMPQFWVFVILVVFSRNRQRMGDIFARTVVIRLLSDRPSSAASQRETDRSDKPNRADNAEEDRDEPRPPGADEE